MILASCRDRIAGDCGFIHPNNQLYSTRRDQKLFLNGSENLKRILIFITLVSPAIAVGDDLHIGLEAFDSNMRSTATFGKVSFNKRIVTYNNAPGIGLIGLHSVAQDWALSQSKKIRREYWLLTREAEFQQKMIAMYKAMQGSRKISRPKRFHTRSEKA